MRLLDKACQRSEYDDDTTALEEPSTCSVINADAGRDLVIGDSWFGSVTTTDCLLNKMRHGKDSILQVKTAHSLFPKKYIESVTKDWPGGSHIVLKTEFKGKTMYAVGYKYCSKKTLLFIFNEGAAGTEPGVPYRATWIDENNNQSFRDVPRPQVCAIYFGDSNVIDILNSQRQYDLKLEKLWVTQDGYFRMMTSVFGCVVVDMHNSYQHHLSCGHRHKKATLLVIVSMLTLDCLTNNHEDNLDGAWSIGDVRKSRGVPQTITQNTDGSSEVSSLASPAMTLKMSVFEEAVELVKRQDDEARAAANTHKLEITKEMTAETKRVYSCKTELFGTATTQRRRRFVCSVCKNRNVKTSYFCICCEPPSDKSKGFWVCPPSSGRDCQETHICEIYKQLKNKRMRD